MSGQPDPKPEPRIRDPEVLRAFVLAARSCEACGVAGVKLSGHHVLGKGGHHKGDDVRSNLVALCGDGTTGCHGAYHRGDLLARHRVGWAVIHRPDILSYLRAKLGQDAANEYLRTRYALRPPAPSE